MSTQYDPQDDNAREITSPVSFWDKQKYGEPEDFDFRGVPEYELEALGEDEGDPKDSPAQESALSAIYKRVATPAALVAPPAETVDAATEKKEETPTKELDPKTPESSSPTSSSIDKMMSGSDGPLA